MTDQALSRDKIAKNYFRDETELVHELADRARLSDAEARQVDTMARKLVDAARAGRRLHGGVDALMHEYSLSSEEGVVLMCLAEALLRVPDAETADQLIADKIGGRNWEKHLGSSESLFVNASTWGLMLTGRVIALDEPGGVKGMFASATRHLGRLVNRSGEPVIRQAMRQAMRILGKQFVLGRTIQEALRAADEEPEYRFSFDMLGEAAVTAADADSYFNSYMDALTVLGEWAGRSDNTDSVFVRASLSVKLSALHPRFEPAKEARLYTELVPRIMKLARKAKHLNLGLTIDAEEADRLNISLGIFESLLGSSELDGWDGLGLAVQAYGRRALPVLEWLGALAKVSGHKIPVRLVKGAYWDTEIKLAQEGGFESYPLFTRKSATDTSYIACARFLLDNRDAFYPQLATHNAHTIAAVMAIAGDTGGFELQRLHGMGKAIYDEVVGPNIEKPCRIYAPVGSHEDLLAYLVRRLLENGANTSFVNRLGDDDAPVDEIIADPVARVTGLTHVPHPRIPAPADLFMPERGNARGLVLTETSVRAPLLREIDRHLKTAQKAGPLVGGEMLAGDAAPITSPHDTSVAVGSVIEASETQVDAAIAGGADAAHGWDRLGGDARAALLEKTADLYEQNLSYLMAVIIREAGKTLDNALGDIREAVDFLRYYAARARLEFSGPGGLPGPTGERNTLALNGRGLFACISPWNFPLAIFTGQVSAALAAGNAVIAKPAEQTPLVAAIAVRLFHQAGVPGDVLQLLPGRGEVVGAQLVSDARIDGIVFTGSNQTAALIHRGLAGRQGPIVPLIAETGGMNAMIVDSSALPEQAVKDAVRSAFDSAGQRCSALRVLFLQEDSAARVEKMLLGAMEELQIGDPLEFSTDVGPVIDAEAKSMLDAHKVAMKREQTELIDLPIPESCGQGTYVGPAAYAIDSIDVLEREVFGPVVHLVRYQAGKLDRVCAAINKTGYGLTLGIHSRIDSRIEEIIGQVKVGNIYVNRNQVGAIVGSQPFGGEGLSGTGPKAGGPHYLPAFAVERVVSVDTTASGGNAALMSLGTGLEET